MNAVRFRYSASILKTRHTHIGLGLLLALVFGSLLTLILPNLPELSYSDLYQNKDGNLMLEPMLFAVAAIIGITITQANRRIRLELSRGTLNVHIPRLTGLGLLGLTTGDHRIPLSSIKSVELTPVTGFRNMAQAINQSRINLTTNKQTYRFQPYNFLAEGGPDHRLGFSEAFGKPKDRIETLVAESPFVKALASRLSETEVTTKAADRTGPLASQYNLLEHKGMLAALTLLTVLSAYALVDYVMLTNFLLLGDPPLWPFVSSGLVAAVVGIKLGAGAPTKERLGVAALLAVIAMAATYPGIQRYTLLAAPAAQTVSYEVADTAYFINDQYPAIDQRDSNIVEYWRQQTPGGHYKFRVYPPVMGFTLVDMGPVYEQSRAFYQAREEG